MDNSTKIILGSVIVALSLIIGLVVFFKPEPQPVTLPLIIEEFSDFQCPACGAYWEAVNTIKANEDVEFEYRHFPLVQIHDRAYAAAVASEAAREQGKFQEYHDVLFQNQPQFTDEDFYKYAEDLTMDVEKFKEDYHNNQALKDRVDADIAEAEARGISSTPTFYINGEKIRPNGPQDLIEIVNEMIDEGKSAQESANQ